MTNGAVQLALVLIWLSGSNYNTLLTIASEMILVPYFWSVHSGKTALRMKNRHCSAWV